MEEGLLPRELWNPLILDGWKEGGRESGLSAPSLLSLYFKFHVSSEVAFQGFLAVGV